MATWRWVLMGLVLSACGGTADVAGDKVGEARKRLSVALENGEELYRRARERAIEGAKVTDAAIHRHPYQAIAIGVGITLLAGLTLIPALLSVLGHRAFWPRKAARDPRHQGAPSPPPCMRTC